MNKLSASQKGDAVRLYLSGNSAAAVAARFGVCPSAIKGLLRRQGTTLRPIGTVPRSDALARRVPKARIEALVADGLSSREIAKELGTCPSAVSRACRALGISVPDRIQAIRRKSAGRIPDDLFFGRLDGPQSWLLGLLLTDGSIAPNGKITLTVMDKDIVDQAASIVGIGGVKEVPPNGRTVARLWRFHVCSYVLRDRLESLGLVPNKTPVLRFPPPDRLCLPSFLRGVWDGDGHWGVDRRDGALRAEFGCASVNFISRLAETLGSETGVSIRVFKRRDMDFWKIQTRGRKAVTIARFLYSTDGPAMIRKREYVAGWL